MRAENGRYICKWDAGNCGEDFATLEVKDKNNGTIRFFPGVLRRRSEKEWLRVARLHMEKIDADEAR